MGGANISGTYGTVSTITPIDRNTAERAKPAANARTSWKDGRDLTRVRKIGDSVHDDAVTYGHDFHPDIRDVHKARAIIDYAVTHEGATIDRGYDHFTPANDTPYIVGGLVPSVEIVTLDGDDTRDALALRLHRFVVQAGTFGQPTAIGIWHEAGAYGDRWTFDVVSFHGDDWRAVATKRNQRAVYNVATNETHFIR